MKKKVFIIPICIGVICIIALVLVLVFRSNKEYDDYYYGNTIDSEDFRLGTEEVSAEDTNLYAILRLNSDVLDEYGIDVEWLSSQSWEYDELVDEYHAVLYVVDGIYGFLISDGVLYIYKI